MGNFISDVSLLWLADNRYFPGTQLEEHAHAEYYQIYYVMDGSGIFLVNGEEVKMENGMFFFLAPGVSHGIKRVDGEGQDRLRELEVKFVVFNEELHEELLRVPAVNWGTLELQQAYAQVIREAIQKAPYYEQRLPNLFAAWLYQMLAQRQRSSRNLGRPGEDKPSARVKQYIDEHFAEDLTLDKLAAISGYSKSYLCQVFREDVGVTVNNYINDVRISHAMQLLVVTEKSVAEVGEKCGYNSVFYFVKTFKKIVGIPPGSFRKEEMTGTQYVKGPVASISAIMKVSWMTATRMNVSEE